MSRLRTLVLGMHYPPEPTGNAPYTGGLARALVKEGHEVRALVAHPHYPGWAILPGYGQWTRTETLDGVRVRRLRHYVPRHPGAVRRLLSELSFGIRQAFSRWGRPDVLIGVSPALISTLTCAVRRTVTHRQTPLIVWVQDIYTLGLVETGQGSRTVVRVMAALEGWLLRRADRVVVIHERFAQRVSSLFNVDPSRIVTIRNWTHLPEFPTVDSTAARERFDWPQDSTVALHAGNMGVKQGLDTVVQAARLADAVDAPVHFVLLGSGSDLPRLRALGAGIKRLQFMTPLSDQDFLQALASADCLVVNEAPGVSEMAVPSKLTSYFAAAKPVIASTDETGITAEEIHRAKAGIVVPAGSPQALLDSVLHFAAHPEAGATYGANARRYCETALTEETSIQKFQDVIYELVSGSTSDANPAATPIIETEQQ